MEHLEQSHRIIRAAIVDDEILSRQQLRELLDVEDDVEVVGEYADPDSASAGIGTVHPDLLFLGGQMPRSVVNSILESFADSTAPATIFVTTHAGFAIRAFDSNAVVDYLLKPFDSARFRRSLARARRHLVSIAALASALQPAPVPEPAYLERLAVKTRGKVYLLRIEEIDWIETAGNYVRLHAGAHSHLYRDSLADFETKLDPRHFVRIHRSCIVNIDRIAQLEPTFHREHVVLLRDGTRLTLTAPYRCRMRAIVGQF